MVGRLKIADDTSPMPRDRLIFDYNYFDGVPLFPGGVGVNRFTPGFEKTFFNGWMSFEMKFPMATTLDSTIVQDGVTNTSHGEFGNMFLTWKTLLLLHEKWAISGGLSVAPPTADDVNVVAADGTPLVRVRNRSTHLGPFLGFLWTPNDRWYAQGFLQYDVAANGNPVLVNQINPDFTLAGLTPVGDLTDTPFQYLRCRRRLLGLSRARSFPPVDGLGLDLRIALESFASRHRPGGSRQLAHRRFCQHHRNIRSDGRHAPRTLRPDDDHLRLLRPLGRRRGSPVQRRIPPDDQSPLRPAKPLDPGDILVTQSARNTHPLSNSPLHARGLLI